ncbi:hypothetical protein IFR05_007246 [Cadophora sp. M221]|nr:hypothetical protein IFR05_007246 [Cadophora sp. M221]
MSSNDDTKPSLAKPTSPKSSNIIAAKAAKVETVVKEEIIKAEKTEDSSGSGLSDIPSSVKEEPTDDISESWPFELPTLRKLADPNALLPGFEERDAVRRGAIRATYVEPLRSTGECATLENDHNKRVPMSEEKVKSVFWLAEYAMLTLGRELSNSKLDNDFYANTDAYNRKWKTDHEAKFGPGTYLPKGHNDINSALVKPPGSGAFVKCVL